MAKRKADPRAYSSVVFDGVKQTPSRAMLRAVGFDDRDFRRTQVGIASTWSTLTPCNMHIDKLADAAVKGVQGAGGKMQAVAIGNKGLGFLNRIGAKVVSQVTQLGDKPHMDKLIGPVMTILDLFSSGQLDAVYLCYTRFINTMTQEPVIEQLLPLTPERLQTSAEVSSQYAWDYIYEPEARVVIDALMTRYIEALVYQAVAENMASEQAARMVAMKAATDNAGNLIAEFKLIYNKTRQAAITKELSEIVGGAAAISG